MKYKVKIKQCIDPQSASAVAGEMSRWSGSTLGAALDAIMTNSVTLQQEMAEDDAKALASKFEALGAETELIPIGEPVVAAAVAAPIVATALSGFGGDDDDDDDEDEGRVLTDAEYLEALRARPEVFQVEKQTRGRNIQILFFFLGLGTCILMATREVYVMATDFFERLPEERTAQLIRDEIDAVLEEQKEEEKKEEIPTEEKKLRETKSRGVSASAGGGDPRARVTKMGVLAAVSGSISNVSGDLFAQGGFATDIDAILSGVGGLRQGGDGGVGRQGVAGIGFGSGFGSGFGGGGGGLDLGALMGGGGGSTQLKAKKGDGPQLRERATPAGGMGLTGGRTMQSIRRVVMQNMGALRHAYNRRLREKPDLNGVVTVRFSIDEFGTVISATMTNSTVSDPELEQTVVERVKSFVFEKIDKPGDITEVTYPFAFTQ